MALVVGGAWLGTTLPNTLQTLFAGERTLLLGFFSSVFLDPHWWNVVLPGAVIAVGLNLQSEADGIELVKAAYADAAQVPVRPPGTAQKLSEQPLAARPRLGLLDRVRQAWSNRR
ncbi:hypothetical protein [Kribbella jiaozuonensis]|uniref:Uncharacterized protein n=1 Tax=Kribbella jiaozuonensis TaxID=2575441 RepID=A0A4U3M1U3_9ACTN|nr:hypothetical protein [Kribbella jiaozuonensis]TKK82290.1 hypothetical protein FDA38_05665 [Kribbella jiaozuonensis]